MRYISTSLILLSLIVVITCGIYPAFVWCVAQICFPFQANGSMLKNAQNVVIGSELLAQKFSRDEFFHPRPSASNYNASASSSSALAVSNYKLRSRIANTLGPIVYYKDGDIIARDIDKWFALNKYNGKVGIVAQWAQIYPDLALQWVNANPTHLEYIENSIKEHPDVIRQYLNKDENMLVPTIDDLTVTFFKDFSRLYPGKFPKIEKRKNVDGVQLLEIQTISNGDNIQSLFFDMWLRDNPNVKIQNVESDMVTTSASGLDPDITVKNAMQQLKRISNALAKKLNRDANDIRMEIKKIIHDNSYKPLGGLVGEELVNVLKLNICINQQYVLPDQ